MNDSLYLDTAVSFDPYFGEPSRDGDQGYEILADGKVKFRDVCHPISSELRKEMEDAVLDAYRAAVLEENLKAFDNN